MNVICPFCQRQLVMSRNLAICPQNNLSFPSNYNSNIHYTNWRNDKDYSFTRLIDKIYYRIFRFDDYCIFNCYSHNGSGKVFSINIPIFNYQDSNKILNHYYNLKAFL